MRVAFVLVHMLRLALLFPYYIVEGQRIQTEGLRNYKSFWLGVKGEHHLVFQVQACSSALLVLAETPYFTTLNSYEFEIGSNGKPLGYLGLIIAC